MKNLTTTFLASALLIFLANPDMMFAQGTRPSESSARIPLDQLGAVATKQVGGNSLLITATPQNGSAHLRCAFQRLQGHATPEGLWLRSTADTAKAERLRVVAVAVGRANTELSTFNAQPSTLSGTGKLSITDQLVRFIRPGVVEEYSVSVDGVRQDFVVMQRPTGIGDLCVELALSGATAEPTTYGAKLTLKGSGRTLAYSRLRATDATGRELPARMEVLTSNSESRKQKAETSQSLLRSAATSAGLVVRVDDADATYPIRIDPTFSDADWVGLNPGIPGANDNVNALVADDRGNIYAGGWFTAIGSVVANHIAKWDGSEWSALGEGVANDVFALAMSGNDLYVGGIFSTAGGVTVNSIAKWDGSTWSALGSGMGGFPMVRALAVMGTNVYAGGYFTTAGGTTVNRIARWDGSSWFALGSGMDSTVFALAVSGSDLYVGGIFTTAGGVTANRIARWNGSAWSALGLGLSGDSMPSCRALTVIGNELYVGGDFTTAGGMTVNGIAKWSGSTWSALGSGVSGGPVWVCALTASGTDLYAGGWFTTAGGISATNVAKWNGSTWSPVGSGTQGAVVEALAISSSNLYVGGNIVMAGEVPLQNIAGWDGTEWSALGSGMGGGFDALTIRETDLYVGGSFDTVGGVVAKNIAKWDGSTWSALGSGINGRVGVLAVGSNYLYAGGSFDTAGGISANNIAKWSGDAWSTLGSGITGAANSGVGALALSGTDLYVGGYFTTAGGLSARSIAKWNGSAWSALGSGLGPLPETDLSVNALAVSGTDLYVGGLFGTAGGIPANGIAKWNGTSWSALGSGIKGVYSPGGHGNVEALAVSATDLYAGGSFTSAGGVPVNNIARWNGSAWSTLGSGITGVGNKVSELATVGTDLYAGGSFDTAGGVSANNIAKWDGSAWSALGSGLNGRVGVMTADNAGHLFVVGGFTLAGTTFSPYLAQANLVGLDLIWSAIASPQEVGVPFPVTVTAKSYAGAILTNFTDTVNLSGDVPGVWTTNLSMGAGTNSWSYPLYTSYHDARTQVIYLTNELGQACTLNSLALEVTTPPGQTLENWTIRLKHTALAEYPASPSWESTDWTVVYQGDEPAGNTGWRIFEFSTPFDYNGTNNLLIDFSFNNASYSSEGQCRSTVQDAYRSLTYASDSKDDDPLSWSGPNPIPVRSDDVPNLVLGAALPALVSVALAPTSTTLFVKGIWTGEVTVHEAAANVVLRALDGLGHEGESNPFDVQRVARPPVIVTGDGQMGITNGFFGFNVEGRPGQVVVVEVSTNLVDWLPLQTNTLGSVPSYFSDPDPTNFTQRFYRAVTH